MLARLRDIDVEFEREKRALENARLEKEKEKEEEKVNALNKEQTECEVKRLLAEADAESADRAEFLLRKPLGVWCELSTAKHCVRCTAAFGLLLRRHHCRECGELVCASCSVSHVIVHGIPKRCCSACHETNLFLQATAAGLPNDELTRQQRQEAEGELVAAEEAVRGTATTEAESARVTEADAEAEAMVEAEAESARATEAEADAEARSEAEVAGRGQETRREAAVTNDKDKANVEEGSRAVNYSPPRLSFQCSSQTGERRTPSSDGEVSPSWLKDIGEFQYGILRPAAVEAAGDEKTPRQPVPKQQEVPRLGQLQSEPQPQDLNAGDGGNVGDRRRGAEKERRRIALERVAKKEALWTEEAEERQRERERDESMRDFLEAERVSATPDPTPPTTPAEWMSPLIRTRGRPVIWAMSPLLQSLPTSPSFSQNLPPAPTNSPRTRLPPASQRLFLEAAAKKKRQEDRERRERERALAIASPSLSPANRLLNERREARLAKFEALRASEEQLRGQEQEISLNSPARSGGASFCVAALVDRQQRWVEEREVKLQARALYEAKKQDALCTFQPAVVPSPSSCSYRSSTEEQVLEPLVAMADRQVRWQRERSRQLEARRQRQKNEELAQCTFRPQPAPPPRTQALAKKRTKLVEARAQWGRDVWERIERIVLAEQKAVAREAGEVDSCRGDGGGEEVETEPILQGASPLDYSCYSDVERAARSVFEGTAPAPAPAPMPDASKPARQAIIAARAEALRAQSSLHFVDRK